MEVSKAFSSPNAIVFLNVQWSKECEIGRLQFAQFILDHRRYSPNDSLECKFVDVTEIAIDRSSLTAIPGWLKLTKQSGQRWLLMCKGEIAWVKHGRVIHVQPIGEFRTTQELMRKTDELMKLAE